MRAASPRCWASPTTCSTTSSRFANSVMSSFAESYAAGETPIPCVTCNQQIKFRDLLETAKDLGADALATGHYIERREGASGPELARARRSPSATRAISCSPPRPSSSATCCFPLGAHAQGRGARARARASACPLPKRPTARTSASCRRGATRGVIERLKPGALKPGDIVHVDGRGLGRHDGIINYTDRPAPRPQHPRPGAALRRPPRCRAQRGRRGTARQPCARPLFSLRT